MHSSERTLRLLEKVFPSPLLFGRLPAKLLQYIGSPTCTQNVHMVSHVCTQLGKLLLDPLRCKFRRHDSGRGRLRRAVLKLLGSKWLRIAHEHKSPENIKPGRPKRPRNTQHVHTTEHKNKLLLSMKHNRKQQSSAVNPPTISMSRSPQSVRVAYTCT